MQAITVKYLSPTNTRGARLKASCDRGSIAIPYPHELNRTEAHTTALRALVLRFKREDTARYGSTEHNPWSGPWVEGTTKDGTTVFVNTLHAEPTTII